MWYLLNAYWIPLLLAGLLGIIVGWMSCNNEPNRGLSKSGWFSGWIPAAVAVTALAALAAVQTLLQGKQGLLLDTALMLFGTYMLGCCIGCMLKPKPAAHLATAGKSVAAGVATGAAGLAAAKAASTAAKSGSGSTTTTTTSKSSATTTAATTPVVAKTEPAAKPAPVASLASTSGSGSTGSSSTGSGSDAAISRAGKAVASTPVAATPGASTITTSGTANGSKVVTALGTAAAASAAAKPTTTITAAAGTSSDVKVFTSAPKFGVRPVLYSAPRGGKGDELSLIWGVAEKLEHKMNAAGIWHFDQIAHWTEANIEWFEHEFEGFKGRLERDKWIEQCKKLAAGWRPDGHVGQRSKS